MNDGQKANLAKERADYYRDKLLAARAVLIEVASEPKPTGRSVRAKWSARQSLAKDLLGRCLSLELVTFGRKENQ